MAVGLDELVQAAWGERQSRSSRDDARITGERLLAAAADNRPATDTRPAADTREAGKPGKETLKLDDGQTLEFELDADGKVQKMTVGPKTFTRQGNTDVWDYSDQTTRGVWNGNIELNKDGSYSWQVRASDSKVTVKKNGNSVTSNSDGSSVESNKDGVVSITYPDKKAIIFERDKGNLISVTDRDGTKWTRDGNTDTFKSDKNAADSRTQVAVTKEAVFSYKDKNNIAYSYDRKGNETARYPDSSSIEKTAAGLITRVKRSNNVSLEFEYDDKQKLTKVTIDNSTVYSRRDGTTEDWSYTYNGKREPWKGDITVRPDGTCLYRDNTAKTTQFVTKDAKKWVEGDDKSRVDLTTEGNALKVTRADGTSVDCEYENGTLVKITENWKTGKAVWQKKAGEDRWRCNDYIGAQRLNLTVSKEGVVRFDSVGGTKFITHTDNTQTRQKEDGTVTVLDSQRQVTSAKIANDVELGCTWKGNSLTKVEEKKDGKTDVWEKDEKTGVWTAKTRPGETRTNIKIEDDGSYTWVGLKDQVVNEIRYFDGTRRKFENTNGEFDKVVETGKNGSKTWTRKAGTNDWSDGILTEERKDVKVSADGLYTFHRPDGAKQIYNLDATEDIEQKKKAAPEKVEKAGLKFWDMMQKAIPDAKDRNHLRQDMEAFYRRATANGVSDDQVAKTLDTLSALVEPDDSKSTFKKTQRVELAKELIHHIAYPRAIDQGFHNTCNVATVQVVMAAKEPEKFVDVIKQAALTAAYTTPGGTKIDLDANSLKPDWQSKLYKPWDPSRNNGGRSFASQLFQVAAINTYYRTQGQNRRYEQVAPENPEDTGERLVDTTNGSVDKKFGGLTGGQVAEISRQMTGKFIPVLATNQFLDTNVTQFASAQDLRTKLEDLQKTGKLPAVISVNMAQEPYFTETGRGRSGTTGPSWHVVTIWNIDRHGQVLIDNQWGRRADREGLRRMNINTLWQASQK